MKIIDPLKIEGPFPVIVLSSHTNEFVSWAIRWFSKGAYNHVMWLYEQFFLASQDLHYNRKSIRRYLLKGFKLKFWALKITDEQREILLKTIEAKLKKGGSYDFLGVVGQIWPKLRFINIPWTNYCSESVEEDLRNIFINVPYKPTPEGINQYCKDNPDKFEYLGHWLID